MTRNRFSIFFGLFLATGCNLDLDDLLDHDMGDSSESGESGDMDESGGGDSHADDNGDGADGADGADAADGTDGTDGADGADGADTSGGDIGEVPAEVLGAWITGDESAAMLLELHDDGTFLQGLYYEYDDAGCWTTGTEAYSGTFTIDASTLTLAADQGAQQLDQCGTASEGQDIAETVELAWTLGADDLGDALTLDDGTGALVFHRNEDGGSEGGA